MWGIFKSIYLFLATLVKSHSMLVVIIILLTVLLVGLSVLYVCIKQRKVSLIQHHRSHR